MATGTRASSADPAISAWAAAYLGLWLPSFTVIARSSTHQGELSKGYTRTPTPRAGLAFDTSVSIADKDLANGADIVVASTYTTSALRAGWLEHYSVLIWLTFQIRFGK